MNTTMILNSCVVERIFSILAEIGLVIFTAILAWATIKLSNHTKALSKLTERLVNIEIQRDTKEQKENRRKDLIVGLTAAENIQRIYPGNFAQKLNTPVELPLTEMHDISTLHSLKKYITDPDCQGHLDALTSIFDSVRREKSQVKINEQDVEQRVKNLQARIQWFVDDARAEIALD
jgi:chorismate mutase